jgi:hypothetical protein
VADATMYHVFDDETYPPGSYLTHEGDWIALTNSFPQMAILLDESEGDAVVGVKKKRYYMDFAGSILTTQLMLGVSVAAGRVLVDIKKNGTTIFTDALKRLSCGLNEFRDSSVPDVINFVAGDYFTVEYVEVGVAPTGAPQVIGYESQASQDLVITRHPSAQVGDLQFVSLWVSGTATPDVPTTADGWVRLNAGSTPSGVTGRLVTFWRKDTGAAGPWTLNNTNAGTVTATTKDVLLVRNQHATTPIDDSDFAVTAFTTNGTGPTSNVANAPDLEILSFRTSTTALTVDGAHPGDAGYTVYQGFDEAISSARHFAVIARPTNNAALAAPTTTWTGSRSTAQARIQIRGTGSAPGEWSPGEAPRVVMNVQKTG